MLPDGYGFLRNPAKDCFPSAQDPYVSAQLIKQLQLRPGDLIVGEAAPHVQGRGPQLTTVTAVNDRLPEQGARERAFDKLTPINPECLLRLETDPRRLTTRVIDVLAPLGKGQRGLIVAPPRSGKTVLLQHIGQAIGVNHPEVELIVLLVDERPEEVTEMRRHVPGQVFASSLDREVENHVRLSRLVVEHCKRRVEQGKDVFLLIDSITRMARAFNKWVGNTGRTMSGGVDIKALDIPKKLFAAARAFEEGGSLTVLATALVETGSRMDDLIYEEFKGTGNLELVLDRRLADRRIWPAIDLSRSGTRREEKLLDPNTLQATTSLRRALSSMHPAEAMEQLIAQLFRHDSNREFLHKIQERAARAA
jgi:transcription termination factor Rho